jgi:hypothetical protein
MTNIGKTLLLETTLAKSVIQPVPPAALVMQITNVKPAMALGI